MIVPHPSPGAVRVASALAGIALILVGVAALFTIENSAGSLFLVGVGLALVLLAALGRRLQVESFEFLGTKVKVREVVKSRIEFARADAAAKDQALAAAMRAQALAVQELHDLYSYVRRTEPASNERTAALDRLVAQMRTAGGDLRFERAEVVTWFDEGNDALRIVAIAIMQAREDCRYFPVVLKAVERPHSLMEQYQALKLGEEMIDGLDRFERRLFRDAIVRAQRKRRFKNDAPLMRLSERILGKMIERRPSETQAP